MFKPLPEHRNDLISFSFLFLTLGVVYSSCVYFKYVFHNDVFFWFKLDENSFHQMPHYENIVNGRYAAAWLIDLQGLLVHNVSDLRILRFLAILLLSCNAYVFLRQIRRIGWSDLELLLITLAIFILPGFADSIFNVSNDYLLLSVLFACWAFSLAERSKGFFVPTIILLTSITFYQTAAMFYWTMTGMSLLFTRNRFEGVFKYKMIRVLGIGLLSLLSYAFLIFLMSFFWGHKVFNSYNVYKPTFDLLTKLHWFFREPLLNALNLWGIFPKWTSAFMVLGFIVSGVLLSFSSKLVQIKREDRLGAVMNILGQFGFFIVLLILSFLPNLIAQLNAPWYRCLVPLTCLICLVLIWSLDQWTKFLPVPIGRIVRVILLSVAVIYGGIKTFDNVLYYRVLPSHIEWQAYRSMAQNISSRQKDKIYIICPDFIGFDRYDEFGVLTSQSLEDVFPLLISAFRENKGQEGGMPPFIYISLPEDNRVLRMNEFIFMKDPGGKWYSKRAGSRDRFQEFDPVSKLGSALPVDRGTYETQEPIPLDALLKQNPYILNLRQLFSPMEYIKIIK